MPNDFVLPAGPFRIFAKKPRLVGRRQGYLWFPTITMLAPSTLLVTAYAGEDALTATPSGSYFWSKDNGETWTDPVPESFSEVSLPREEGQSLLLPFAMCGTEDTDRFEGPLLVASSDTPSLRPGGAAFLTGFPRSPAPVEAGAVSGWAFNGQALPASDGHWLATVYGTFAGDSRQSLSLVESADLRSWRFRSVIADANLCPLPGTDGPCESSIARLGDDRLLCLFRLEGRFANVFEKGSLLTCQPYARSFSADDGRAWNVAESLPAHCGSVQPCLLRLKSGELILAGGRPGLHLSLCRNENATEWHTVDLAEFHNRCHPDEPIMHNEETTGYSEITRLPDGTFGLVYDRTPFGWKKHPGASPEVNSVWFTPFRIE